MTNDKSQNANINYAPKEKRLKNKNTSFGQQKVSHRDIPLLLPAGLEKPFLFLYFIFLPYIAGLMFIFFYVGEGEVDLFLSLNEKSPLILTWLIGYEILALVALLFIIKSAISFSIANAKKGARNNFQRP